MGKGAYLTFINKTDLKITFGTSDKERCWKDETIGRVHGEIEPHNQSEKFYIEGSSAVFSACKGVSASVKFKVEETGNSANHFANVQIKQDGSNYSEIDRYVKNLNANSIINHAEQDEIKIYITKPINNKTWITDLVNPTKLISEVNIPGTHDSGTASLILADFDGMRGNIPIDKNTFAKCQDNDIESQLNQGIRFLDIRLSSLKNIKNKVSSINAYGTALNLIDTGNNNELYIVHDKILYNNSFKNVLNICKQFLEQNKQEFIVMSIKPDGFGFDDSIWEKFYDDDPIFYKGCNFPTVEQARGKIVLLRRFGEDKFNGFDFWVDDNKTGNIQKRNVKNCKLEYQYVTQDKYDIDLEKAYEKQSEVSGFIDKYGDCQNKELLIVNYISFVGKYSNWSTTAWIELPYPREAAEKMNPWLHNEIEKRGKKKLGILPMDFPPQVLIDSIINSNKFS